LEEDGKGREEGFLSALLVADLDETIYEWEDIRAGGWQLAEWLVSGQVCLEPVERFCQKKVKLLNH